METVVIVALAGVRWAPPGVDAAAWRAALAEDTVDLVQGLAGADAAIAAAPGDLALAEAVRWPTTRVYRLADRVASDGFASDGFTADVVAAALAGAAADGYLRAAVLCADAPDLPAMLVGKLLRPLTTRPVALAPAVGGGLLGVAATLPAPGWLVAGPVEQVRAAAPHPSQVGLAPAWHRLRTPDDLRRLDAGLEGWEATRTLVGALDP
jgi:hypothetical protein